ncbi:UDP-N-acetylmuramate--L-alanine ligase [Candidatus Gottesmanbacteria bacterium]|nr:UDP-N-acetylmuramate--L-alanine ligase [Candidatus Gottesmanbacteria bacterium]
MNIDWEEIHSIHFVGLKGVAMTALAVWAKEAGFRVSGSDVDDIFPTDEILADANIRAHVGFDSQTLKKKRPDLVIYTGAHGGQDNDEVREAKSLGIRIMSHGQALGEVMRRKRQISVAGSHGKTTTTAMIATILCSAGKDPSYAIGCGKIFGLGLPGRSGYGDWFLAEADEYVTDPHHDMTPRFLWQNPEILVVTNIDFDHPDAYSSLGEIQQAFVKLASQQQGRRVTIVNADDEASAVLLGDGLNDITTYGLSPRAGLRVLHVGFGERRTFFTLSENGVPVGEFTIKVPGLHNVVNAAAAAAAARSVGVRWDDIKAGLLLFGGTKRRFEEIGKIHGCTVYDDYAHHPKEIQATLAAARAWYPKQRIITVFQPHTYSRTKALLAYFGVSFDKSDIVVIADIYASAREHDTLGITSGDLASEIRKRQVNVHQLHSYDSVSAFLLREGRDGDIMIFMGAGDIAGWGQQFVSEMTQ